MPSTSICLQRHSFYWLPMYPSVCAWSCIWSLWTRYLTNHWWEFHQIYSLGTFWDKLELIWFWDQKVKDEGQVRSTIICQKMQLSGEGARGWTVRHQGPSCLYCISARQWSQCRKKLLMCFSQFSPMNMVSAKLLIGTFWPLSCSGLWTTSCLVPVNNIAESSGDNWLVQTAGTAEITENSPWNVRQHETCLFCGYCWLSETEWLDYMCCNVFAMLCFHSCRDCHFCESHCVVYRAVPNILFGPNSVFVFHLIIPLKVDRVRVINFQWLQNWLPFHLTFN